MDTAGPSFRLRQYFLLLGFFRNSQNELFLGLSFESNFTLSGITTIRFLNLFSKVELLAKTLLGVEYETETQP
jgi:hypothetical protein